MRAGLFASLAVVLAGMSAQAAVHTTLGSAKPLYRQDAGNLQFVVNTSVQAGAKNSSGALSITADSNPMQAISQAAAEWNAVATAAVHIAPPGSGSTGISPSDGVNGITIEDTAETRSIVGDALAVTMYEYMPSGVITDSDIVLNPAITMNGHAAPFSTTHAAGSFDLQAVVSHEMGHALGADHSGLLSSTMFQTTPPNGSFVGAPKTPLADALSADDISFVSGVYPSSSASSQLGTIQGTVTAGAAAVVGATVFAVSPSTGQSICTLTKADGSYTLNALPPDTYLVYAQPLTGPVLPQNLYSLQGVTVNTSFRMAFYGGNAAPAQLTVSPGSVSQASISVVAGAPTLELPLVAIGNANLTVWGWTGAGNTVQAGQTLTLLLTGSGIDGSITASDVRILGPSVTVRSVKPSGVNINGLPALAVTVDIAPRSTRATDTIVVTRGSEVAAYSGGLVIAPSAAGNSNAPSFTAAGMKNAASYQAGTVAPGEIFALFGSNLGPSSLALFQLDSQNRLPTTLGGTQVLFDGIPAPLIYTLAGQVSGIVPYGLSGASNVVVTYNGAASTAVSIPVISTVPGLFTVSSAGTGPGSILNWDPKTGASLNTSAHAAARGGTIVAYGTGDGFFYGYDAGTVAGAGPNMKAGVTATIGGVPATVAYAGNSPGLITGLWQINIQVPSNAPTGAQPLVVKVNGVASQAGVTVAVK